MEFSIAGMVITGLSKLFLPQKIHSDIMKARQEANDMPTYQYLIRKKGKGKIFAVIPICFLPCRSNLGLFYHVIFMQLWNITENFIWIIQSLLN